ncbi:MAG: tryptophan--tRNA ligase, partial [Candidatus Tantalella remota]|nr:tryptophan--tRNA ligase [Candidatus Tantalella remota]
EGNPVFIYHDIFNPDKKEVDDLKDRYRTGNVGDVEVKQKLTDALNAHLDPIRRKRSEISDDEALRIIKEGALRARKAANETMSQVKECLHQIKS